MSDATKIVLGTLVVSMLLGLLILANLTLAG